ERSFSLLSVKRLSVENDELRSSTLLDHLGDGAERVRELASADPVIARRFFDARGELALVMLQGRRLGDEQTVAEYRALQGVVRRNEAPGFRLSIAGLPVLKAILATIVYRDIRVLFIAAVAVCLLVQLVTF